MNPPPASLRLPGQAARAASCLMLAYWGVFAAASPVLTIDSQMYNLARLELALRGGFFASDHFTSIFQVMFPWGFDAVHLPFLTLGWGLALPSYACLLGVCHVAWMHVRDRFGADLAWLAVLCLLALPCLVYQATSTKNDLAVAFGAAVWLHARLRQRREGGRRHVAWMVLALGFLAGAKHTGLLAALLLGAWTLWDLRPRPRLVAGAAVGLVASLVLFGSLETYVESWRLFGDPLGPTPLVRRMSNRDGLAGGAANLLRHTAAGVYVGQTDYRDEQQPVTAWNDAVRGLLARLHLTDRGTSPLFPDRRLFFHQSGLEELSGFGPVGTLALVTLLATVLAWRPREVWWRLGAAALLVFVALSLTIAYTAWSNRYLLAGYALATVGWVCLLAGPGPSRALLRGGTLALAAGFALAAPLLSYNRGPASLAQAFTDRETLETSSYPIVGETRRALRQLHDAGPGRRIFLLVNDESVLLPLLRERALGVVPVTAPVFAQLDRTGRLAAGDLVVCEQPADDPRLALVRELVAPHVYSLDGTLHRYIYRISVPPGA